MAYICENCNFKYISKLEEFCVNCGYSFDYIRNYKHFAPAQLKRMPGLIKVRQAVCSIPEKDTTKKRPARLLHHHQSGHSGGGL